MAHFAELKTMTDPTGFTSDSHQVVQRVVVIGNDIPVNGGTLEDNDMHVDGETWCGKLFKTESNIWKQTSYNNNFRKQYAGKGDVYDPVKDKFLGPQPYASWSLDSNDDWQPPIAMPPIIDASQDQESPEWVYFISWNDAKYQADNTKGWQGTKSNDEEETKAIYDWNGTTWQPE